MPRSRRRRPDPPGEGLDRLISGWKRTETRRGVVYTVQPLSAHHAANSYVCPGCEREVAAGAAHVVVWRADGILGDAADLAARRHWHTHCWRIG